VVPQKNALWGCNASSLSIKEIPVSGAVLQLVNVRTL